MIGSRKAVLDRCPELQAASDQVRAFAAMLRHTLFGAVDDRPGSCEGGWTPSVFLRLNDP